MDSVNVLFLKISQGGRSIRYPMILLFGRDLRIIELTSIGMLCAVDGCLGVYFGNHM